MENKKNRICVIGDIHGRSVWKQIVEAEKEAEQIIFVGDYFDSRDGYAPSRQIANFKEILDYKRANMDKVILLTGNHDLHYMKGINEDYSGYQFGSAIDIQEVIEGALKEGLLQMCYIHNKYLISHAGVTMTWCADHKINMSDLERSINDEFKFRPTSFKFLMGDNYSQTGDDICQGPVWVRPLSLYKDKIDGYIFIVGHTSVTRIDVSKADMFKMKLIDALYEQEYLIIENDVASVGKIQF